MSKKEKLIARVESVPKDLTYEELLQYLKYFGFALQRQAGSRRKFVHEGTGEPIGFHQPHPNNTMPAYVIRAVVEMVKDYADKGDE